MKQEEDKFIPFRRYDSDFCILTMTYTFEAPFGKLQTFI